MRNRSRITITIKNELLKNVDRIIDGTKIKNRSHAIEFLLAKNFGEQKIKKAVILAGGGGVVPKGKIKPVSRILTDCKGKMFVEHVFDWLKKEGIKEVIISAGDLSLEVKDKIGDGSKFGLQVSYLSKDTGTASVLKYLVNIIDETFLMMNGDVLSDVDLDEMFDFHKKSGGLCTIGMISVKEPSLFGTIKLKGSQIVDFIEKPKEGKEESYLINAGIYLVEPEI
ncbi:MAG: hypothetical protein KAU07_03685, partial [Candidatus Andersenbacteria bacterium]|nr:hypothetical protein [Candidatus Andersenbacteria bacterium]